MKYIFTAITLSALLSGCGEHNHGDHKNHSNGDQKNTGMKLVENLPEKMAAARGKITGFTDELVMIDHGDIQGTSMGPMNMGFGYLKDVDVSGLKEGDEISFLMKVGRDDSMEMIVFSPLCHQWHLLRQNKNKIGLPVHEKDCEMANIAIESESQ